MANETPRSVPPSPSGEPNAFRIAARGGQRHLALGVAEGDLGLQARRIGAARGPRPRLDFGRCGSLGCMRRRRGGLAGVVFAVQPGDEVLERRRLPGEVGRALPLRAEGVLRRGERLLARVDEGAETHFIDRQRLAPLSEFVALDGDRVPGPGEGVEIVADGLDLRLQFRNDRTHDCRRPHRFRHVVGLDENGGWGIAAHALKGGKHIRDHRPSALERTRELVGRGVEARQFVAGCGGAALGVLNLGGGLDQRRRQATPIGANRLDFGLDRTALLLRGAQRIFDPAQLGLLVRARLIGRGRRIRRSGIGLRRPRRAERGDESCAACCGSPEAA